MDKRIENIGVTSRRKLPKDGETVLKLKAAGKERAEGAWGDFNEMVKNVELDEYYPKPSKPLKPESGITLRNELLEPKDKKIAKLLSYISKIAGRTVKRLEKEE